MFKIDEPTIMLGIIGPATPSQIEDVLHAAINEGKGDLHGPWHLKTNAEYTFAISYKHASNQGIRMDPARISGLARVVRAEVREEHPIYFWIDRIARRRLGTQTVNWGNLGLAPYSLFRTVLAPQWHHCSIQEEHKRMWLRMEAVLSACCKGYFVPIVEEAGSDLLLSFGAVLGPSTPGRYVGMRYSPDDTLKELAVSIICGNWDVSGTSFPQDKIDAREWAEGTIASLDGDPFVKKAVERMVMRQLFGNTLPTTGKLWKRPSKFGISSSTRAGGANLLHPPIEYLDPKLSSYSNATGKTVVIIADTGVIAISVDDCGWSLPVGHYAVVHSFSEEHLTGQVKQVKALEASNGMTGLLFTIFEAQHASVNAADAALLKRATWGSPALHIVKYLLDLEKDPVVHKVLIVNTDDIRFTF